MDKAGLKQQLKSAKEEFMKKNFLQAAKLCETVLKADPCHTSGLILYGACLLEMPARKHECVEQFQKVIDAYPGNVFAWQGVEQYYEKCDKPTVCRQLFRVYGHLLCLDMDRSKSEARAKKCVDLWKNYKTELDVAEFVDIVLPTIKHDDDNDTPQLLALYRVLAELPFTNDTACLDRYMERVYTALCDDDRYDGRFDVYCKFVAALKSKGLRRQLADTCERMLSVYRDNAVAINFFCEAYISNHIKTVTDPNDVDTADLVKRMDPAVWVRADALLSAQLANPNSLIAKAVVLRRRGEFEESRRLLRKVLAVADRSWQSWFLLTEVQANVRCYDDVIRCVRQSMKIVKPGFSCYSTMVAWEIEARCCCRQCCTVDGRRSAIDMIGDGNNDGSGKFIEYAIVASCHLNDQVTADHYFNTLRVRLLPERLAYLDALYRSRFGRAEDAVSAAASIVVTTSGQDADALLLLGDVLLAQQRVSEAGDAYLRASRLVPYRCDAITRLGHYYRDAGRLPVAVTCYERSVLLNPDDEDTGLALSDAYTQLGMDREHEALLGHLKTSRNAGWACLRLGVHCLHRNDYGRAVDNLQLAVKRQPDDADRYECLGDALLGRGSLIAAKLTYGECSRLDPGRLYPKLRTADIDYRTGLPESAIESYREIVAAHPDDTRALLDAAQTYLDWARTVQDRQPLSASELCRDTCACLYRTMYADHDKSALVWKLFGDLCVLVASMPPELAHILLPSDVFDAAAAADSEPAGYLVAGVRLYAYGRRCYAQALNITCKRPSLYPARKYLWYDMAVCYLKNAKVTAADRNNERLELVCKAGRAMEKCLALDPHNAVYWNAMGVIRAIGEDDALSYSCFVESLKVEINASAYNNLGVLCLQHGDADLAREAFALSQHVDPTLVNSWVGLGLVARATDDATAALQFFYHSTTVGRAHAESVCSYTAANFDRWSVADGDEKAGLASALCTPSQPPAVAEIRDRQHNVDALFWHVRRRPDDGWAQHALSVLCRRAGLHGTAVMAAERAEALCGGGNVARRNVAFALLAASRYREAADKYQEMGDAAAVHDRFGMALALYKTSRRDEAHAVYESLTAEDAATASAAFLAMASMTFEDGGVAATSVTTLMLLKSIRSDPGNVQAFLAAFALGIVTRDGGLSRTMLNELVSRTADGGDNVDDGYRNDVARFEAYFHYLNRRPAASLRLIARRVHDRPGDAHLWTNLGFVLLNYYLADGSRRRAGLASQLFACAADVAAGGSGFRWGPFAENALLLSAVADLSEDRPAACLRAALRGVHSYPASAHLWTVLLNAVYCRGNARDASFLKAHVGFVARYLNPGEFLRCNLAQLEAQV